MRLSNDLPLATPRVTLISANRPIVNRALGDEFCGVDGAKLEAGRATDHSANSEGQSPFLKLSTKSIAGLSREQIRASLRKAYESAALVQHQPAVGDRIIEVVSQLEDLARSNFRVGDARLGPCGGSPKRPFEVISRNDSVCSRIRSNSQIMPRRSTIMTIKP